jgi:hypothetical protein
MEGAMVLGYLFHCAFLRREGVPILVEK